MNHTLRVLFIGHGHTEEALLGAGRFALQTIEGEGLQRQQPARTIV